MSSTTIGKIHSDLKLVCLNIEGSQIFQDKPKATKWANLVVVLDRPIVDNVVFDTILNHARTSKFPILENAVTQLNEPNFLVAWQAIIAYYLCLYDNGNTTGANRATLDSHTVESNRMCIHIHQFPEFKGIVDYVKMFIVDAKRHYGLTIDVDIMTDNPIYQKQSYTYVDNALSKTREYCFVLSLSQAAGLDPRYEPGALLIPTSFVPFDGTTVYLQQRVHVINELLHDISIIFQDKVLSPSLKLPMSIKESSSMSSSSSSDTTLSPQRYNFLNKSSVHNFAVAQLNNYKSANSIKQHKTRHLTLDDFYLDIAMLQIDRIWNPTDPNERITIQV